MPKKTVIILALMLLVSALLGSSVLTRGHWWGDDFAAYIMQAKSILAGNMDEFVAANTFTVTQSSHQIGPAAYPWGFPLMLAPVYALIGLSPLALKLPGLLTYLGFLLVFFFMTKRRFLSTESLLAVSLFAFNPELLRSLDNIASDIPFLFISTLSILLADMYAKETQNRSQVETSSPNRCGYFRGLLRTHAGIDPAGKRIALPGHPFFRAARAATPTHRATR